MRGRRRCAVRQRGQQRHADRAFGHRGRYIGHLETFSNTSDADFVGFTGGGVKGVLEFEVEHFFTHDEQANGLWCDHDCVSDRARGEKGAWFQRNVSVDNGHHGTR